MENFHSLHNSLIFEDRMSHDLFLALLDAIFGQHERIQITPETESEKNQKLIKDYWTWIRTLYCTPDRVKYVNKCVRQTLLHIVQHLNNTYHFQTPIKFEPKRIDCYDKSIKNKVTRQWTELTLS